MESCSTTDEPPAASNPVACFTVSPATILVGEVVTFNSSCSENANSFSWELGDGSTSTSANPTHSYSSDGDFVVTLIVTGTDGNTNSSSKTVTIELANSGNMEHGGTISSNETWVEGVHLITDDIYVEGVTITIEPGSVIKFNQGTAMYFGYSGNSGATLIANGTADKGITFTSSAATKTPGDWYGIWFYSLASKISSMKFSTVEYGGGYTVDYGEIHVDQSALTIENSTVHKSEGNGITLEADAYFNSFINNTVIDNGAYPIAITSNYAHTIGVGNTLATASGILLKGSNYDQTDETWLKQTCPYIIDDDLYIQSATGAKLTLSPGVVIALKQNSGIYIGYNGSTYGTLIAEGKAEDSIHFTSAAPAGTKSPGDWYYIGFYDGAGNSSILKYCAVEYGGGYSTNYGEIYIEKSSVNIDNSSIRNSETYGIKCYSDGSFKSFTNNNLTNNGKYPVQIYANFLHTIGTGNTYVGAGIGVTGNTVDTATPTWLKQQIPYVFDGDVYVQSATGTVLTIEAGTTLKFTGNSAIYVGYNGSTFGSIVAEGTAGNEIIFTSAAPAGNESPGDWYGIWFYIGTSANAILDHCIISYGGGYSSNSGNIYIDNTAASRPTITNCQITDSEAFGIYLGSGVSPTLSGNIFTNNALGDTN